MNLLHASMRILNTRGNWRCCYWKCILIFLTILCIYSLNYCLHIVSVRNFLAGDIVDFSNADNISGYSYYIVPDVVHFIHFNKSELNFIDVINIKAVYKNHKPKIIIIHCDCYNLTGKYWGMLNDIKTLQIQYKKRPTHIFGKRLSSIYHASDVARLQILMSYGGIYLDNDVFVVKSLDFYRRFEFAVGWPPKQYLGNQVLIAHKNSRFLKLWYQSYKYYRPEKWYYNAGELPTESILLYRPELVHKVPYDFGVHNLAVMLYDTRSPSWRNYHAIHLLTRHRSYLVPEDIPKNFDETNIKTYNKTFGDMARSVLYGKVNIIN